MDERERLAADLETAAIEGDNLWGVADRLIDLGWTRLDEKRWYRAFATVTGMEARTTEGQRAIFDLFARTYREDEGVPRKRDRSPPQDRGGGNRPDRQHRSRRMARVRRPPRRASRVQGVPGGLR